MSNVNFSILHVFSVALAIEETFRSVENPPSSVCAISLMMSIIILDQLYDLYINCIYLPDNYPFREKIWVVTHFAKKSEILIHFNSNHKHLMPYDFNYFIANVG